jgi:hypothetical protein
MKNILFALVIGCISTNVPILSGQNALPDEGQLALSQLASGTIVVRVPTQGKKIAFLNQSIAKTTDSRRKKQYLSLLEEAKLEDRQRFSAIARSFERHFTFTNYAFVPDSLYRDFLAGKKDVFLREGKAAPHEEVIRGTIFVWLELENKNQFGLFTKEGTRLPDPLPYRRNTFLSGFKRWFIPEKYIDAQVRWLQRKLSSLEIIPSPAQSH